MDADECSQRIWQAYLPCLSISLWMEMEDAQLLRPPSGACFRHSSPTTSAYKARRKLLGK